MDTVTRQLRFEIQSPSLVTVLDILLSFGVLLYSELYCQRVHSCTYILTTIRLQHRREQTVLFCISGVF